MDLWFLEQMPDQKEAEPHERQEHQAQCELSGVVVVEAQVPIGVRPDIFARETHADGEEKDSKESEAQLDGAGDWGGYELIKRAGSVRG